jgi:hypothetical protein
MAVSDNRFCVEEGIVSRVFRVVFVSVVSWSRVVVLIQLKVGRSLDDKAVSWDGVSRYELDDVPNNQVPNIDCFDRSLLAPENGNCLIFTKALESHKLLILHPIYNTSDDYEYHQSHEKADALEPS